MIDERGNVVHDVHFAHPIERVWDAIVDRDALAQWLMANDHEPRVGHRFQFDAGADRGAIDAEVLDVQRPHRLQWRWMIDDVATIVTITLRTDGDGTALHLEHAALPPDPRSRFDDGWVEKFVALEVSLKGAA